MWGCGGVECKVVRAGGLRSEVVGFVCVYSIIVYIVHMFVCVVYVCGTCS